MSKVTDIIVFDGNPRFSLGGGQRVTLDVMAALKDDYRIHLVEVGKTPAFFNQAVGLTESAIRLLFPVIDKSTRSASYNLSLLDAVVTISCYFVNFIRIAWYLRRFSPSKTVLYSAAKKSHPLVYFLKHLAGYKTCVHLHTIDEKTSRFYPLFLILYRSFDLKIAPSLFCKRHFELNDVVVVPNCYHFPRPPSIQRSCIKTIAVVASLVKTKGVAIFLEAIKSLPMPGIEYWVIGDGSELHALRDLARPEVVFKGHQNNLKDLYASIDLIVVPSLVPEAFGIVLVEAFANGIPVLTTNIGAQQELVKENQNDTGVPPGDAAALAERIQHFLLDPVGYREKSELVRRNSDKYHFTSFKRNVLEALRTTSQ